MTGIYALKKVDIFNMLCLPVKADQTHDYQTLRHTAFERDGFEFRPPRRLVGLRERFRTRRRPKRGRGLVDRDPVERQRAAAGARAARRAVGCLASSG